jgi:type I restriction enzyme, S subunit
MAAAGWETVTLGDLLERVKRPIQLQPEEEYQTVGLRSRGAGLFLKPPLKGKKIAAKTLFRVDTDDIVYSRLFSWQGSFGVVDDEQAGAVASGEFPTFITRGALSPEFFRVWASQPAVWSEAELMCTGTTAGSRNRLKEEDFLSLEVDLPPIDEQLAIVAATTAISDAVSFTEAELAAATALRKVLLSSVYEELNERAAETRSLGELADVTSGMAWSRDDECDAERGVAALRVANVQLDGVDLSELRYILPATKGASTKRVRPHSLILVRTNTAERVGNAQFLPEEAVGFAYSSFLIQVTPNSPGDLSVIARCLQAPEVQAQMTDRARGTSASLTNIPVTWLRELEIPILDIKEKGELLAQIDAVEATAAELHVEVNRLRALWSSTLSALLSGERHVRDSAAIAEEFATA